MLLYPSPTADARVEMYNADGSRMKMCGNGIRCAARFLLELEPQAGTVVYPPLQGAELIKRLQTESDHNHNHQPILARTVNAIALPSPLSTIEIRSLALETDAGLRQLYVYLTNGRADMITVDAGPASLCLAEMACTLSGETAIDRPVTVGGYQYEITCISTGNLHGVVFTDDLATIKLHKQGPALECASFFPDRANIHFVQVLAPDHLKMIIWERGSGPTRACGTGACAAVIAASTTGRASPACVVDQPGGRLLVDLVNDAVYLTGEAMIVCSGTWHPDYRSDLNQPPTPSRHWHPEKTGH